MNGVNRLAHLRGALVHHDGADRWYETETGRIPTPCECGPYYREDCPVREHRFGSFDDSFPGDLLTPEIGQSAHPVGPYRFDQEPL